jgi:hypothetical protein
MKLNKKLSLFLVSILFVSACTEIQQPSPTTRQLPIDYPVSKNGIVYEKPVWITGQGESGGLYSFDMEVNVKNNNNKPTEVIFDFELYSPDSHPFSIGGCSNTVNIFPIWTGSNYIISSNGTAKLRCSHVLSTPIKEAQFSSYHWSQGVIVTPLDENGPEDVEVLETGFEKTGVDIRVVTYRVYARIQSKSDEDVVTRFYVLDNQEVQFISCDTEDELKAGTAVRVECDIAYNIDKINQSPASVIVDVITLDSWEKPVE